MVAPERLRAALATLVEAGPHNTVQLARVLRWTLPATAQAASALVIRDCAERSEDGVYSVTDFGREFWRAGGKFAHRPKARGGARKVKVVSDTLRQRAWTAMRLKRRFTQPAILQLAARASDGEATSNLGRYVRQLERAGYLTRLGPREAGTAVTSNGYLIYQMVRDTGAHAPTVRRDGTIVDRNAVSA